SPVLWRHVQHPGPDSNLVPLVGRVPFSSSYRRLKPWFGQKSIILLTANLTKSSTDTAQLREPPTSSRGNPYAWAQRRRFLQHPQARTLQQLPRRHLETRYTHLR